MVTPEEWDLWARHAAASYVAVLFLGLVLGMALMAGRRGVRVE